MEKIQAAEPSCELIVVYDGAPSSSASVPAVLPTAKVLTYPLNKGKGYALRKGVAEARGEWIIYTDIDFPYTHESFLAVLKNLKAGSEVSLGVRRKDYYTQLPLSRTLISKTLRRLTHLFFRLPTEDTQCSLKGMNRKGREVFLKTTVNRYLFDLEFVLLATKQKLTIRTEEVTLRSGVTFSEVSWKSLFIEIGNFLKIISKNLEHYELPANRTTP